MAYLLSIVVPSYNEGKRIDSFLEDLFSVWSRVDFSWELIVVEDGSLAPEVRDTAALLQKYQSRYPQINIHHLILEANRGKGGAIQAGIETSGATYVGFLDADGATAAHSALETFERLRAQPLKVDAAFGSRIQMLGRTIERDQRRHIIGRVFATLIFMAFRLPIYDSQCGCKFFKRKQIVPLLTRILDSRWTWDTQLVLLLSVLQARLIEVPVDWREVAGSKIRVFRDAWRMFWQMRKFHAAYFAKRDWVQEYQTVTAEEPVSITKKVA